MSKTGKTTGNLKMRSGPGMQFEPPIAYLVPDTQLEILDEQGDWLHVRAAGKEGYVGRKYVAITETPNVASAGDIKQEAGLGHAADIKPAALGHAADIRPAVLGNAGDITAASHSAGAPKPHEPNLGGLRHAGEIKHSSPSQAGDEKPGGEKQPPDMAQRKGLEKK